MNFNNIIIVRIGEIHLKGKNKRYFEKLLENNITNTLKTINCKLNRIQGRYFVDSFINDDLNEIINRLKKVFGITSLSVARVVKSEMISIFECCKSICKNEGTFKVETNRADKTFISSMEVNREIGHKLLEAFENLKVDVKNPDFIIHIDIRETGYTFIFSDYIKASGGMPSGSAGKGTLLISGGIDSPVAGYMMAKRGMKLEGVHFHSFPYTSELAKDKVVELSKIVSKYSCGFKLIFVPFTHIQEAIHQKCSEELMITLMRRFMMRIAERIALTNSSQCLITGESLGQVASQTIEGIITSNSVVKVPVLRPLIGFDKQDIVEISEKIGTYNTSILPYEDCCTVFLPKNPSIKPRMEKVLFAESKLDIEALINESIDKIEIVNL